MSSPPLVRPREGRLAAGVCAAVALRLGWSPVAVRLLFLASLLLPGPQILLYLLGWVVIPGEPQPGLPGGLRATLGDGWSPGSGHPAFVTTARGEWTRLWSAYDPRLDLRADDTEREQVAEELQAHGAAGRLTVEELEGRLDQALSATTRRDLVHLLHDLPPLPAAPGARVPGRSSLGALALVATHGLAWLLGSFGLLVLWAASGVDYPWPVWPIIGWLVVLALHARAATRASNRG
jgi:phage shock protein PspC (stress-responsive transcriptional regulator)